MIAGDDVMIDMAEVFINRSISKANFIADYFGFSTDIGSFTIFNNTFYFSSGKMSLFKKDLISKSLLGAQ